MSLRWRWAFKNQAEVSSVSPSVGVSNVILIRSIDTKYQCLTSPLTRHFKFLKKLNTLMTRSFHFRRLFNQSTSRFLIPVVIWRQMEEFKVNISFYKEKGLENFVVLLNPIDVQE